MFHGVYPEQYTETLLFAQGDGFYEGFSMTGWTFVILSGAKNLVLKNIQ